MTRAEHLAWCKERALAYVARGELVNAVASMASDLNKHSETRDESRARDALILIGALAAAEHDAGGVTRWIEGFN
jgi:hypothetical protein